VSATPNFRIMTSPSVPFMSLQVYWVLVIWESDLRWFGVTGSDAAGGRSRSGGCYAKFGDCDLCCSPRSLPDRTLSNHQCMVVETHDDMFHISVSMRKLGTSSVEHTHAPEREIT